MRSPHPLFAARAAVPIVILAASIAARAQTTEWSNGAGDGRWSNAANWTSQEPAAATDAELPAGLDGFITLSSGEVAASLATLDNYKLLGGTLSTPLIDVDGETNVTVRGVLAGSGGFAKEGDGVLRLENAGNTFTGGLFVNAGVLAFAGSGAGVQGALGATPKAVTIDNGAFVRPLFNSDPTAGTHRFVIGEFDGGFDIPAGVTLTLDNGTGSTAQLRGTGALTKTGLGFLQLGQTTAGQSNFSGFTGDIEILDGQLAALAPAAGGNSPLGDAVGITTVSENGSLRLAGAHTEMITLDDADGFRAGSLRAAALHVNGSEAATLFGAVDINNVGRIGGAGALTLSGNVASATAAARLIKSFDGTVNLTAANTFSGSIEITGGTLALGGANGSLAGATKITLRETPNAATLKLDNSAALNANRVGDAAEVVFHISPSILNLTGNVSAATTEQVGKLTADGALAAVQVQGGSAANPTVLSVAGLARNGGGVFGFQTPGALGSLGSGNKIKTGQIAGAAPLVTNGIVAPWMFNATDNVFISYDPLLGFTNAAATQVNLLAAVSTDIVHDSTPRTLAADAVAYALRLDNSPALSGPGRTVTIGSGGLIFSGLGSATHSVNWIAGSAATLGELLVHQGAGEQTFTGTIAAGALTKTGGGALMLARDNAATLGSAPVALLSGTLDLAAAHAAGNGPILSSGGATLLRTANAAENNALTFRGGSLELQASAPTTFATGAVAFAEGRITLALRDAGGGVAHSLPAALTIGMAGVDEVELVASSDGFGGYSLHLGGPATLAADLRLDSSGGNPALRFSAISEIGHARAIRKVGAGLVEMRVASTYSGGTEIVNGTLQASATAALGTGLVTLGDVAGSASANLQIGQSTEGGTTMLPNDILVRGGAGPLKITADRARADGTKLVLNGDIALERSLTFLEGKSNSAAESSTIELGGAITGTGDVTFSGVNSGGLARTTITLTGESTFDGTTTIAANGRNDLFRVHVAGSLSAAPAGVNTINVAAGGILSGSGEALRPVLVNANGRVEAGLGLGEFTVGALMLGANSTFGLEIDTSTSVSDLLTVEGDLSLDSSGSATLSISDLGNNAAITPGTVFAFIEYHGSWNGGLFQIPFTLLTPVPDDAVFSLGGRQFRLDYNFGGNQVALIAVPEPSTLASIAGGIGVLMGWGRLRKRR